MIITLFVAFCVVNLLSTLFIFSACTISGREAEMAEIEQAALLQHISMKSALKRISTVQMAQHIAAQA